MSVLPDLKFVDGLSERDERDVLISVVRIYHEALEVISHHGPFAVAAYHNRDKGIPGTLPKAQQVALEAIDLARISGLEDVPFPGGTVGVPESRP